MVIDVHAHSYPAQYLELIGRPDLPPVRAAALARQGTGERLALLGQAGIDTQVLSVSQSQPYLPDPGRAAGTAKVGNGLYAELCVANEGRLLAFPARICRTLTSRWPRWTVSLVSRPWPASRWAAA